MGITIDEGKGKAVLVRLESGTSGVKARSTTADRVLSVLELFDLEHPDWSIEEASARLGIATSTAYRYFASLSTHGLIASFVPGRYVLGPAIARYDRQVRLTDPLISAARGPMRRVAELQPAIIVAFLCRLLGGQVICVDQVSVGELPFAVGYERGRLMPLFAGSASKVILAHLASRPLRALYRGQPEAFAQAGLGHNWEQVKAALRGIRASGAFETSGEVDPGMRGISVPLIARGGAMLGSLNVAGPSELVAASSGPLISELRAGAAEIISQLPPGPGAEN